MIMLFNDFFVYIMYIIDLTNEINKIIEIQNEYTPDERYKIAHQ